MEQFPIKIITPADKDYPGLLKEIYHPPKTLYYRGTLEPGGQYFLSVVGTRKPSVYGQRVVTDIVREVAQRNIIIVSGLAFGIDALSHMAAIDAGGKTWAVLGSGLDQIYPATNRILANKILKTGGALISEYPIGTPPLKQHFPARNRIISGLSLGTLIVEAPEKSGALITAFFALEQNREVLAVPGNIHQPNSAGTNQLIKLGAKVVTGVADVLELFQLETTLPGYPVIQITADNSEEEIIIDILRSGPQTVDQISQKCKLDISIINSSLSLMIIAGKVKQIDPLTYTLNL